MQRSMTLFSAFKSSSVPAAPLLLMAAAALSLVRLAAGSELESEFFREPVQITMGATKAGEGYFSPDARLICYQAIPQGDPFYQIYLQPIDLTAPRPTTPLGPSAKVVLRARRMP